MVASGLNKINTTNTIIVCAIFGVSIFEFILIIYIVIRDMIKKVKSTFVIKDHFTVYFIIYSLLTLVAKLFLLDTYYKNKLFSHTLNCSQVVSEFCPQLLLVISFCIFWIKTMILSSISLDTCDSFKRN